MFVAELCPPVGTFGWPSPSLRLPYRCIANKRLPPDPRSRNGGEVGGAELCLFSRFYERSAFDGVLSGTCAEGYSAPPLRSAQDRPQKRRGGRRRTRRGGEKKKKIIKKKHFFSYPSTMDGILETLFVLQDDYYYWHYYY